MPTKPAIIRSGADIQKPPIRQAIMPGMMQVITNRGGPLYRVLTRLNLLGSLALCLDAGDSASYSGSGQTWTDLSPSGANFNRGSGSGSDSADPTFNGTAGGASSAEYWSFDGGDYFTPAGSPTFDDGWHKNNATWTIAAAFWKPTTLSGAALSIFSNENVASMSGIGVVFLANTSQQIGLVVCNGSGSSYAFSGNPSSGATLKNAAWNFVSVSINEASSSGGNWNTNGVAANFNPTYTSPSASNPSQSPSIFAYGNNNFPAQSTCRLGWIAAWSAALSAAQLAALYEATRTRYGI
jgi:hypothetical protein